MDRDFLLYQQGKGANHDNPDDDDQSKAHMTETGESPIAVAPYRPAVRGFLLAIGAVGMLVFCLIRAVPHSRINKTASIDATEQKNVRIEGDLLVITHDKHENRLPDNQDELIAIIKDEANVSPNDVARITQDMENPDEGSLSASVKKQVLAAKLSKDKRAENTGKDSAKGSAPHALVELNGQDIVGGSAGVSLVKDKTCVPWKDEPTKHKVKVCGYRFNTYWNPGCEDLRPDRPEWMTVDGCDGCSEFSSVDKFNFGIVRYYDITECPNNEEKRLQALLSAE